jgi:hypothetical protein
MRPPPAWEVVLCTNDSVKNGNDDDRARVRGQAIGGGVMGVKLRRGAPCGCEMPVFLVEQIFKGGSNHGSHGPPFV